MHGLHKKVFIFSYINLISFCLFSMDRLKTAIAEERPGMAKKKVLFQYDNAPVHLSRVVLHKLTEVRFELLPYPVYSPDLAPSNFHLFRKLNTFLAGQKFVTMKKPSRRSTTIPRVLKKTTSRKESGTWKNVGPNALNLEEIMSDCCISYRIKLLIEPPSYSMYKFVSCWCKKKSTL